jgi:chromate transporter
MEDKNKETIQYFLTLGATGFGGPVALAAMMQNELVEKRNWISREEFDQAFPLIKSMPGALAFQTAVYLGFRYGGISCAILAGICLVLPAALMMIALAHFGHYFNQSIWVESLLIGFQSGAMALIALACLQLAKPFKNEIRFWIFCCFAFVLAYFHLPEPLVIISFGLASILISKMKVQPTFKVIPLFELVLIGLMAGAFVFGTGLAALPWLEKKFVFDHQWLSQAEFLQAVAFGQMTPGPVLVTMTYLGYKLAGLTGAIFATIAIFIPGFIHMTTWFPKAVRSLSKKTWVRSFSIGAIAAVVGSLVMISVRLFPHLPDFGKVIFSMMILLLFVFQKIPSWAVILISGAVGMSVPILS